MDMKYYGIRSEKNQMAFEIFSSFQINELLKCPFHREDSSASRNMQIELILRFFLTRVRCLASGSPQKKEFV